MRKLTIAAVLALTLAPATVQAQNFIYQQGTPNRHNESGGVLVGTEPAGGYDHSQLFAPFMVSQPVVLGGVVLPIEGDNLIVELGTGPVVQTNLAQGQYIQPPAILAQAPVPGHVSGQQDTNVPIPGGIQLVPGRQYFIIVSASDLGRRAGVWLADYYVQNGTGMTVRGQWYLAPDNHPGGYPFAVYAAQ